MNNIVTLDQLLNVGDAITVNSTKNNEFNQLIDDYVCNQYNILDLKKKLLNLISEFKSARYLYDFPTNTNIRLTPSYTLNENQKTNSAVSQVENAITHYVDKQIETTEIYNTIIKLSSKLTSSEAVYLINTFLIHRSEESIAEILQISKTYLQRIKKSCIVKMWVDLKPYCEKDD